MYIVLSETIHLFRINNWAREGGARHLLPSNWAYQWTYPLRFPLIRKVRQIAEHPNYLLFIYKSANTIGTNHDELIIIQPVQRLHVEANDLKKSRKIL